MDFFLGMIETTTPPGFSNQSMHNPHHIVPCIFAGGPLKEKDCYPHERMIGGLKSMAKGGRKPGLALANASFLQQRTELPWMRWEYEQKECPIKVSKKCTKTLTDFDTVLAHLPWSRVTLANLGDDEEFHLDDTVGHETFTDSYPSFQRSDFLDSVAIK